MKYKSNSQIIADLRDRIRKLEEALQHAASILQIELIHLEVGLTAPKQGEIDPKRQRTREQMDKDMASYQQAFLLLVEKHGPLGIGQLIRYSGIPRSTASHNLEILLKKGQLVRVPVKDIRHFVYTLPPTEEK